MAELIFAKYSDERSRRFAIRTDILEENGVRFVRKTAVWPEGQAHVEQIYRWYRMLDNLYGQKFFSFNRGRMENGSLVLEYVQGQTLEEVLDELCVQGEVADAAARLREYLKQVKDLYAREPFVMTGEFREVFGKAALPEGLTAAPVTNIDMVCGNLVLGASPVVLDYEWTFDFPIPCEFVLYRIIRYSQDPYSDRKPLCDVDFYGEYGITEELQKTFLQMELHFQDYITAGHVPMREMYKDMNPGSEPLRNVPAEQFQIFFDNGQGYTQENSRSWPIKDTKVSVKVMLPADCLRIRLDPGDNPCAVSVSQISFDGAAVSLEDAVIQDGCQSGRWIYIARTDPNIAGISVPEGARELVVKLRVYPVEQKVLEGMCRQLSRKIPKLAEGKKIFSKVKRRLGR